MARYDPEVRILVASLLLAACASTSPPPDRMYWQIYCHTICEVPGDATSCSTVCDHDPVVAPTCKEICRDEVHDERASCVDHCKRPPSFVCGTPEAQTVDVRHPVITLIVLSAAATALGAGTYFAFDWLSYQ